METQTTEQFLRNKIVETETELQNTKGVVESLRRQQEQWVQTVERIREWAFEQLDDGASEEGLAELSHIVGFELKKDYQVVVQVEYAFNLKASNDNEVQEIIDGLDIPRLSDSYIEDDIWGEVVDSSFDEV